MEPTPDPADLSLAEKRMLLARLLRERERQGESLPVSPGQRGFWILSQTPESAAACNFHLSSRLRGDLAIADLRGAFEHVQRRHPCLRTTFEGSAGEPLQRLHQSLPVRFELRDAWGWDDAQLRRELAAEAIRPFDLERGPLWRTLLYRVGPRDHLFLAVAHHIVVDYWSVMILLKEVHEAYVALGQGLPCPDPPLPATYADHVREQGRILSGDPASPGTPDTRSGRARAEGERAEGERLRRFWRDRLDGAPVTIDLPTDHPRPARFTHRGGEVPCHLPAELLSRLKKLARSEGVTPYSVLLAGLQVLLYRYSGQQDLVIGSPFSGRSRSEFAGVVGCFMNLLPIRGRVDPAGPFRALVRQTQRHVLEVMDHQQVPFPLLVESQGLARDFSRPPLAQVSLTLEQSQVAEETGRGSFLFPETSGEKSWGGIVEESFYVDAGTCQLELEWVLEAVEGGVVGVLRYCRDLYRPDSMRRMVDHFRILLSHAVDEPDRPLGSLPWFGRDEQARLSGPMGTGETRPAEPGCVHTWFERQAAQTPAAIAVRQGERRLRYDELDAWADRVAGRLRRDGIGPGDRVAVAYERSPEMLVAMLAVFKAGAAYVPLDPSHPPQRLATVLGEISPRRMLSPPGLVPGIRPSLSADPLDVAAFADAEAEASPDEKRSPDANGAAEGGGTPDVVIGGDRGDPAAEECRPEDVAYVIFTSGSTGRPKGVVVEHGALANTLQWRRRALPVGPGDRVLMVIPAAFDASLCVTLSALISGAELLLPEPGQEWQPSLLARLIATRSVTVVPLTPRAMRSLVDEPAARNARSVRLAYCGGEAMPADLPQAVHDTWGVWPVNLYGPTEAAVEATWWPSGPAPAIVAADEQGRTPDVRQPVDDDGPTRADPPVDAIRPGSMPIGRPIDNVRVYVLDGDRRPVPIGVPGELYIGGAGLARGYWNDPELTAQRFVPDPFSDGRLYRSGDRCRWSADGYLEFLGRLDDQVKIRGVRIELAEVEQALSRHASVADAAAAVHPPAPGAATSELVGYVVLGQGHRTDWRDDLRAHLARRLPASMLPRSIVRLDRIPRTTGGKIDRRRLSAPPAEPSGIDPTKACRVPPRTELQSYLADLWRRTLRVDAVGLTDGFHELGGTSLQGAIALAEIQDTLGLRLHLATIFEQPHVEALAAFLAKNYPDAVSRRFGRESLAGAVAAAGAPPPVGAEAESRAGDGETDAGDGEPRAGDGADGKGLGTVEADACLVRLNSPLPGDNAPLFLVHPPGGIIVCYYPLAHCLDGKRPVYGIRSPTTPASGEPVNRLEDLAAGYVRAIRSVRPDGPYLLGGWSLGGVIAFEMAQQLIAAGQRVGPLALLDTGIPASRANRRFGPGDAFSGREYGLEIGLEELAGLDAQRQLPYLMDHARKLGLVNEQAPPSIVWQIVEDLKAAFRDHIVMASRYAIRPFPGKIVLFRPADAPFVPSGPADRGWANVAGDVEVHQVPGQHHSMVQPPHVRQLAAILDAAIDRSTPPIPS